MTKPNLLALAISLVTLPALAQTTTTTTYADPPQQAAPPPTQAPATQVVVNPQPPAPAPAAQVPADPPPPVVVQSPPVIGHDPPAPAYVPDDTQGVQTTPSGRSAGKTIAIDALYGGVAGGLVGGGITLIDQGHNWSRDLMVGGGVGILVGGGYGIFESATRAPDRAIADRDPAASTSMGLAPAQYAARF